MLPSITDSSVKISSTILVHISIQSWLFYDTTDQASMPLAPPQSNLILFFNLILIWQKNNVLLCLVHYPEQNYNKSPMGSFQFLSSHSKKEIGKINFLNVLFTSKHSTYNQH